MAVEVEVAHDWLDVLAAAGTVAAAVAAWVANRQNRRLTQPQTTGCAPYPSSSLASSRQTGPRFLQIRFREPRLLDDGAALIHRFEFVKTQGVFNEHQARLASKRHRRPHPHRCTRWTAAASSTRTGTSPRGGSGSGDGSDGGGRDCVTRSRTNAGRVACSRKPRAAQEPGLRNRQREADRHGSVLRCRAGTSHAV
jgi:hypothetical protein